jgi:hypothetical protein
MTAVVKFEVTKRKLDWKQEEELRLGKKRDSKRRTDRQQGRESKVYQEGDE